QPFPLRRPHGRQRQTAAAAGKTRLALVGAGEGPLLPDVGHGHTVADVALKYLLVLLIQARRTSMSMTATGRRTLTLAALVAAAPAVSAGTLGGQAPGSPGGPIAGTANGLVRGVASGPVDEFL